jgi:hypothetical protein
LHYVRYTTVYTPVFSVLLDAEAYMAGWLAGFAEDTDTVEMVLVGLDAVWARRLTV